VSAVPDISVVVATHDRRDRLRRLLDALEAQTLPRERFEVIVVDDGSSDGTADVLAAAEAAGTLPLRWERQAPAAGPAVARNRGWRAATAPVVAFTDDDCAPTPVWLEALLAEIGGDALAVVQGATLPDPAEHEHLGPFAKTVRITEGTPHFETCNIAYPRALLEAVGGFDEGYPAPAGEDSDLGWRVVEAGGRQRFAPAAIVHHAVFPQSPVRALRGALMATHGVQAYKANPALRKHLTQGVFYERSHPLLLQAALGAYLARRQPAAALFVLPYALHLRSRCRARHASPAAAPYLALYDVVQVAATLRGAVRHRFPVL
jgi:glycosyltransferase involved in cell wall biosynthesis